MMLIGYVGVKYGLFFFVLLCSVFGIKGVKIFVLVCGFVVCGWFGINIWVGGSVIYVILNSVSGDVFVG